ncbi:hypothetical protein AAGV28_07200 [Flavobacterium sp. FZUC8N2.13]|uniref:Uncharacterized protein n=1 Tax=Flavobacterium zubiriense TaxID=3138075 RepID=A0ABV4TAM8_9FLAO
MSFNIEDIKETIRIKGDHIKINVMIASGKEGEHHIVVSPALLVSGYGSTPEEAKESFHENIKLFCEDLLTLPNDKKLIELKKLGFTQEKFAHKNFSKLYVDENGVLQGLETVKTQRLEATI